MNKIEEKLEIKKEFGGGKALFVDCVEMGRQNSKLPEMEGIGLFIKDCEATKVTLYWCWNCKLYFEKKNMIGDTCKFCGKHKQKHIKKG